MRADSVDFPDPERPRSTTISPGSTFSDTPDSAGCAAPGYVLPRSAIRTAGVSLFVISLLLRMCFRTGKGQAWQASTSSAISVHRVRMRS